MQASYEGVPPYLFKLFSEVSMKMPFLLLLLLLMFESINGYTQDVSGRLTLDSAIKLAIVSDPWLARSHYRQNALSDEAIAVATLPDPNISLRAGNFPVDSFDINQEPMTQLSLGISQIFPRGDSLSLAKQQKEQLSVQEPLLRLDRKAKVAATVAQLWLEAYEAQESIRLIENDRALFEHLVDAARASYSAALGRARQQDLIRAQLELTRLDDRLTRLRQKQESTQRNLSEWIGAQASMPLDRVLPNHSTSVPVATLYTKTADEQARYEWIRHHPALQASDQRIDAMTTGVELAHQKYKPEWSISAQYGYRADDTTGRDRADLFSMGVTFDLPIFTGNRQDKEVSAAVARAEASKSDKQLLARQLMAELEAAIVQLQRLDERNALFTHQLLPQMAEQAEASLTAYNNDDGDFAEAVRARIAELNAKIEALSLVVERQQVIARINYLLAQPDTYQANPVE
jgi:outer membrane protein TolC